MTGQAWRPCWAVVSEWGVEAVFTDAISAGRYRTYLATTFAAYRGADIAVKLAHLNPAFP